MFAGFKKRRAIRAYRNELGPHLEEKHGKRATYSPTEVKRGAENCGLSLESLCYAFAMHCTHADFDAHHAATGQRCDYDAMRREIADLEGKGDSGDGGTSDSDGGVSDGCNSGGDGGGDGGGGGD